MPVNTRGSSNKPVRSVAAQLRSMDADRYSGILNAIQEASAKSPIPSRPETTPTKRKGAPSILPLTALANLNPGDVTMDTPYVGVIYAVVDLMSRPTRNRIPSAKVAASMRAASAKASTIQRVRNAKPANAGSGSVNVKEKLVRDSSPFSISSSSSDELPVVSDIMKSAKVARPPVNDSPGLSLNPRVLFDIEAAVDNNYNGIAIDADNNSVVADDEGSLADFIVPDNEVVYDDDTMADDEMPGTPPRLRRKSSSRQRIPVLAPSPDIITSSVHDDTRLDVDASEDVDDDTDSEGEGADPAPTRDMQEDAIKLAVVLAPLIMALSGNGELEDSSSDNERDPNDEVLNMNVMRPDLQNIHMKMTYDGLCHLPHLYELIPYGYDERVSSGYRNDAGEFMFRHSKLSTISQFTDVENFVSILSGLFFVESGPYMNPSRFDVDRLRSSHTRRLAIEGGGPFCISVMVGVVSECYLIEALDVGTEAYPKPRQHRITIIPPHQEERRAISTMCKGLDLPGNPRGLYSYNGMSFVTNGEKEPPVTQSGMEVSLSSHYALAHCILVDGYNLPKTRSKQSDALNAMFTVTSSKRRSSSHGNELASPTTNFDQRVPILDGRAETGEPFRFTSSQLDSLLSWRTYEQNAVDVPAGSVVAVGYTTNHFMLNGLLYMPTYVKFVVVLSTPKKVVGVSTRPATDVLPDRKQKVKTKVKSSSSPSKPATRSATDKGKGRA
ncbi:hypothetical protein H0H93_014751 [Arthromyces matolae]|nr:hypothetical protein H0H93_014751 [Arthromyces matolae]